MHMHVDTSVLSTTLPTNAVPWPHTRPGSVCSVAHQPLRREEGQKEQSCAGLWKPAEGRNGRELGNLRYQKQSVKEGGCRVSLRHPQSCDFLLWCTCVVVWGVECRPWMGFLHHSAQGKGLFCLWLRAVPGQAHLLEKIFFYKLIWSRYWDPEGQTLAREDLKEREWLKVWRQSACD